MILREPAPSADGSPTANEQSQSPYSVKERRGSWASRAPLRWRLSLVTGGIVAVSVALMTLATYWLVSTILIASVDHQLGAQADALIQQSQNPRFLDNLDEEIAEFKAYSPDTRVAISPPGWSVTFGDAIPIGGKFTRDSGYSESSVRMMGNERVLVKRHDLGTTVVLARQMDEVHERISVLGAMLAIIAAVGGLISIVAGGIVSRTGMQPIARLKRAADYVTQTNDLRPIEVVSNDEMGQLITSFNQMLRALQQARDKQSQFVADAGHELKTPLTSMRTNIELLMMMNKADGAGISEQERAELESDVLYQLTELSTLIGDLVDLAREEAPEKEPEEVELSEVLETSLARARRRRPDVHFELDAEPWVIQGDPFALGRATLNLMDNAAKWSPPTGTVRISLHQISADEARLRVDDSGPGIAPEEREKVFERFYRSAESRSMPGSGLGLAIVRSVVERHRGTITIEDSDDGGARMEVTLPGRPSQEPIVDEPRAGDEAGGARPAGQDGAAAEGDRGSLFVERWFNQH